MSRDTQKDLAGVWVTDARLVYPRVCPHNTCSSPNAVAARKFEKKICAGHLEDTSRSNALDGGVVDQQKKMGLKGGNIYEQASCIQSEKDKEQ